MSDDFGQVVLVLFPFVNLTMKAWTLSARTDIVSNCVALHCHSRAKLALDISLRYLHGNSVDTPRLFYVLRTVLQHNSVHTMRARPYCAAQLSLKGQHGTVQHGTALVHTAVFAYSAVPYRAKTVLSCLCERSISLYSIESSAPSNSPSTDWLSNAIVHLLKDIYKV